ncbi:hypothetical protein PsorP6_003156 [Peronosclerospora sorghi]|uniref:Uncharacterized protein n=1 Tax=Peronosclerospora sorghi TaxID=230839 RepID=A0ACC0VP52_9STRA|nr:hypothetical protein PsorP6_003156 [Peronosclerospora sorghi]
MSRASTAHTELSTTSNIYERSKEFAFSPSGDFRQHDYLSSEQFDLVREQTIRLLPILRKNCVLLTAWDFSDLELNSTIGLHDGDIYRALVKRAADESLHKSHVPEGYAKYLRPLMRSDL